MKKTWFCLVLFVGLFSGSTKAQEVRLGANMLILGYIESPFIGAGAGFEAGLGEHFTLAMDANWGSHDEGSSWEFRPAVNYYLGRNHSGFFLGGALKYISLSEDNEDLVEWEDNIFTLGFNVGVKALLSETISLGLTASPHFAVGGRQEGDVAGISAQLGLGYRF